MKFILENDKLKIEQEKELNSGSLNYYEVDVEFNEAWNNLTIAAILIGKDDIVGTSISVIKNKFYLDNELEGYYNIGFVGYLIENEEKKYQISTNLKSIYFNKGAGEIETEDKKVPTPSEWEIYIAQIQKMISDIKIEELDPTVPEHVKNITEADIKKWNSGTGGTGGKVDDVRVNGTSVVENRIANIDLSSVSELDNVLRDILEAIQNGGTTSMVIEEIEQLIVSYFENKTVEEVEA